MVLSLELRRRLHGALRKEADMELGIFTILQAFLLHFRKRQLSPVHQ